MSYEYFASTLPLLKFGDKPPFGGDALLAAAEGVLEKDDFDALRALVAGGESQHPFAVRWRDCLVEIANAVAKRRIANREKSKSGAGGGGASVQFSPRPHGDWHSSVEAGVAAAYQESDPLRRHVALARLKWDLAGEIAGADAFSASAVLAWAVRLGLLSDLAAIDAEAGLAAFDAAVKG